MFRPGGRGYEAGAVSTPPSRLPDYSTDGTRLSDLYHALLTASWPVFLAVFVAVFVAVNALFAAGYAMNDGIENAQSFADDFFFSVQTFATIGYGHLVPRTTFANTLVTIEVMLGTLQIAVMTGLMFAKFARPTARVLFSRVAIVAPRDGVRSLIFRMANERGTNIAEAQAHVVLARYETTVEGEQVRRFHDLELTRRQSILFAITWTAVHQITERSPLYGATPESLDSEEAELIVSVSGFDESFGQTIHARHHYRPQHILFDARFVDIIAPGVDGRPTFDRGRFHDVVRSPTST